MNTQDLKNKAADLVERQAQNIVTEICTLFHLQETKDWEQKAINLIKTLIKKHK